MRLHITPEKFTHLMSRFLALAIDKEYIRVLFFTHHSADSQSGGILGRGESKVSGYPPGQIRAGTQTLLIWWPIPRRMTF